MRMVIIWLSVAIGGTFLGGVVGGCIGWQIGSHKLRNHPDETVRAAYLAGEAESEDVVPRAGLTLLGGFFGCFIGCCEGVRVMVVRKRRDAIGAGDTASPDVRPPSITLFD
jgi:hypothetical protein